MKLPGEKVERFSSVSGVTLTQETASMVRRRIAFFVNRRASNRIDDSEKDDLCSHGFDYAIRAFHKFDAGIGTNLEDFMVWSGCNAVMSAFNRWTLRMKYFPQEGEQNARNSVVGFDPAIGIPIFQLLKQEVRSAISTLPDRYQFIIRAHYWSDLSLWEVCRMKGWKRYDVDKDHHMALKVLKNQLSL